MAATADTTHIKMVSANKPDVSKGVITIGNPVSTVSLTMTKLTVAASKKPMIALSSAWQMMTL